MLFAVDRAHAQVLQQRFKESGIECGYQDALTPDNERREIKRKFHTRELPIVASVGTLTIGVDWDCRCISFCRPTKSEMLFVQAFGRGLRLAPPGSDPKECLIFLDHSGTTGRLGYPENIIHDQLYTVKEADGEDSVEDDKKTKESTPKPCPACTFMMSRRLPVCPNCGHKPPIESGWIERDGELVELGGIFAKPKKGGKGKVEMTMAEKAKFLAELKAYGIQHNRKDGWAAHSFRERTGVWPNSSIKNVPPAPYPSAKTVMWCKSRAIAYWKSKKRQQAMGADAS